MILPEWIHIDDVFFLAFSICSKSNLLAVLNRLDHLCVIECVGYVEEVLSGTLSPFRIFIWEIVFHPWHLDPSLVKIGDADLIVMGRITGDNLGELEELLLILEQLLQELSIHHGFRRDQKLTKYDRLIIRRQILTVAH